MSTVAVKSALRVIEVLQAFSEHRVPMSQAALIEATGYPQSSMTALLRTLTEKGLLHYNGRLRLYYPTMLVRQLGEWIEDQSPEHAWITALMRGLHEFSGETVALGVQNDTILMYLRAIESDHVVRYHVRPGEQRPLLDSSMGWLLLSRQEPARIERIYRRSPLHQRQLAGDLDSFMAGIERIRSQDHCYLPNVPINAGTISMIIPETFNGVPLVVGVGGFIDRIGPRSEAILGEMRNLIKLHARQPKL